MGSPNASAEPERSATTIPLDDVPDEQPPHSWKRTLYALWFAQLLAIVGFSLRVPFLPFFLEDLGTTSTNAQALWAGMINAGGAGVMAISAPIWGVVADRYGRKPMVLRSMFAATVTIALMGFATAPWHLLGLRFIEGAFSGTVTASTALVASTAPKERTGFALGMIQTAVFSGASLGPLIGGVLASQIGYRPTFWVASGMMLTGGMIVLFLVQERFQPRVYDPNAKTGFRANFDVLAGRLMLTMVLVMLVIRFAASAVQPILPLFVKTLSAASAGDQAALAGLILGVAGLTSAISSVILGRLGDRLGHRRILFWCAIFGGLLYLPMLAVHSAWQLAVLQALFGVAAGGLIPSANAIVVNVTAPERRGVVFGLMAGSASLGGFFGPLAGAGLAAGFGFGVAFFSTGLALLLLALAIYVTVKPNSSELHVSGSGPA